MQRTILAASVAVCLAGVGAGLLSTPLTPFNQGFVATSVVGQVLFLLALATRSRYLTDACHVAMVLSFFASAAFVGNVWLLGLTLWCLVVVQGLWIVFGRCIVNDLRPPGWFPGEHGYGKYSEAVALVLTATVATKFGWALGVAFRGVRRGRLC
jgi:hypothetical protein